MIPDVDEVKYLLLETVDLLIVDIAGNLFVNYTPFELQIGFKVNNYIQALQAANYHEAEHCGIISTYSKLLKLPYRV